jgi:glycosyltransferase involved in cell wall biosynthesis
MAAGLAILAISPANSELGRIVEHFSIGNVVLPGQPEKIAQCIEALASNPGDLEEIKRRSREASLNFTSANAKLYVEQVYL